MARLVFRAADKIDIDKKIANIFEEYRRRIGYHSVPGRS